MNRNGYGLLTDATGAIVAVYLEDATQPLTRVNGFLVDATGALVLKHG